MWLSPLIWVFNTRLFFNLVTADYVKGFGGKFGVQKDRVDKSALGWDYQEKVEKHESQTGIGFYKLDVLCGYVVNIVRCVLPIFSFISRMV